MTRIVHDPPESVWTDLQVAEHFGVTRRTVHRWATAGLIARVRVGGSSRFRVRDVKALIDRSA